MSETVDQAVETPAPDANVPTEVEASADPSPAAEDTGEVRKRNRASERIDELTRDKYAERRAREEAERRAEALQRELESLRPQQPSGEKQKTLEDFGHDVEQYGDYLRQQATEEARRAAREELAQERARQATEQRQTAFQSREAKFAKDHPDYFQLTRDPAVPITAQMAEVIAESEDGPALALHLAKNVELADSIARLPALAQARELGRIEARLAYEREQAEAAKKRVSNAPPPPPKIDATESSAKKDPSEMSDDEWYRYDKRLANLKQYQKKA